MAQDIFLLAFFSLLDLLKGSIIFSIPVFVFVFVAIFVRKALAQKYGWQWFSSSLVTTYFLVFSLVLVIYALPIVDVNNSVQNYPILPELAPTPLEIAAPILLQFFRLLVVALILAFILMPIEFVGLFLFEKISQKIRAAYVVRAFLAVFASTFFSLAIIIFLVPWIVPGIIFLIFYGFA